MSLVLFSFIVSHGVAVSSNVNISQIVSFAKLWSCEQQNFKKNSPDKSRFTRIEKFLIDI